MHSIGVLFKDSLAGAEPHCSCFFAVSAAVPLLNIQTRDYGAGADGGYGRLYASVVLPELQ